MALQNQVALIAGGAKNLGALVSTQLASEGANLAIHYHGDAAAESAETLATNLKQKHPGQQFMTYQGDLTVTANVSKLFHSALSDLGKINIVVNTVGMVLKKSLTDISEQEYDKMFAVNSKSAFFICQEAAKSLSDGGKLITIVTGLLGQSREVSGVGSRMATIASV